MVTLSTPLFWMYSMQCFFSSFPATGVGWGSNKGESLCKFCGLLPSHFLQVGHDVPSPLRNGVPLWECADRMHLTTDE